MLHEKPVKSSPLLDAALGYAGRGWYVFPLYEMTGGACACGMPCGRNAGKHPRTEHGVYDATIEVAQIQHWWGDWPRANIGIATGERSKLVVFDTDPRNGGDVSRDDLLHSYGAFPATPQVLTGGGGLHDYFYCAGALPTYKPAPGIDVLGEAAYVVAPPSTHASGRAYEWEASSHPDECPLAPLPDWLRVLGERKGSTPLAGDPLPEVLPTVALQDVHVSPRIKFVIQTGMDCEDPGRYTSRSEAVFAVITALVQAGHDDATIAGIVLDRQYAISAKPLEQHRPKARVAAEIARARAKGHTETSPTVAAVASTAAHEASHHRNGHTPLPYSDYTNALAFVRDHGTNLRYCYPWKAWLVWTGTYWQRDTSGEVMRRAKQTVKRLARQIEGLDEQHTHALLAHIKASLSTAKLKAMIENAQSEPGIAVQPAELDALPWVLNVHNGTLDLKTGALRAHQQQDLLTKCLTLPYEPDATCVAWDAFLWRIMGGSQGEESPEMRVGELEKRQGDDDRARALIGFLQRALGYSLTGGTQEQCFFLLHGPTKTGKSTFINTSRKLLGDYARQAEASTFLHKDRTEVRNDLAMLAGARLVSAIETDQGKKLAEALVKQATGGTDGITARFLFEELFTFTPQFKVFLATNHAPKMDAQDDAIWERVHRIPFVVQIPKEERDKHLDEKLQGELPGILAWAVRGCLAWQRKNDLCVPQRVTDATQELRDEMDDIGAFLKEVCTLGDPETYKTQAKTLLDAYHTWVGTKTLTAKALNKALTDRKYEAKRYTTGMFWLGIGLPAPEEHRKDS